MERSQHRQRFLGLLTVAVAFCLTAPSQQLGGFDPAGDPVSSPATNPPLPDLQGPFKITNFAVFKELDMLRRDGFAVAVTATVSVRVMDKTGATPRGLTAGDFMLTVNKTPRVARVQAPGEELVPTVPLVLVVFPPNQTTVHSIGVHAAAKYFSKQSSELLPWKVGILDGDGKLTPFTNSKSQLLVNLEVVDKVVQPFQYTTSAGLPRGFRWEGTWLSKAEDTISMMQRFDGPKVILAINPLVEPMYGENERILAHDGPEALEAIAQRVGAHIYIANVGGPSVEVPGGDASASYNGSSIGYNPRFGVTGPSAYIAQGHRLPNYIAQGAQQNAVFSYLAYRSSVMRQAAEDTMGGFSNSFSDLAGFIHRDLDENYSLSFDLTAADRDIGVPEIEVKLTNRDRKVAILDVTPVGAINDQHDAGISKEVLAKVRDATKKPVPSPNFRITQHVDYFPLRGGLEPMLPMSALVEWTGRGDSPKRLSVMESVEDKNLSLTVLDREVQASWNGKRLSWERDGHLHPGHYVWKVAIHDERGNVFTSVEQKITIENPRGASIATSSLIVGKTCRNADQTGGMRARNSNGPLDPNQVHFTVDPMRAAECRLKPESADKFAEADMLRAFVRLYPSQKFQKDAPDKWTASFMLRAASGAVETEKDIPFRADSGSGHLAYVEIPLDTEKISPGVHTLGVAMRGPGIKGDLKESRTISISP